MYSLASLGCSSSGYGCTDCSYTARDRHAISLHIEAKHVTNYCLNCPICGRICPTREAMRKHISRNHDKWYSSVSINTAMVFSGYESLDMVIQSKILTISQNEYSCIECGHICKTKQNISGHIEANHVENHPGVICKVCTKICTTRDALRKHMVRYHAQNPTSYH